MIVRRLRPVSDEHVVDGRVVRPARIKLDSKRCDVLSFVHLKKNLKSLSFVNLKKNF